MNSTAGKWQWDDIRFFLAVAREGSLSAASRALGVGHVTVGRRIALLEKHLGVNLLNRTPDGFTVTPAGQAIIRESEAMESAALNLERLVAGQDKRAAGTVRVSATDAVAYRIIIPAVAALGGNHPELQVDLLTGVRSLDIARREADMAIRFARPADPNLVCRKVGEVGFTLYASPDYLASHGRPARGGGLRSYDLIGFTGAPAATSPFFMAESLEGARLALRCNSPFLQLKAAADRVGITEAACFLGDRFSELIRVWPDEPPHLRPVWLILHEDLRRASRIRIVASAIVDTFQRDSKILRYGLPRHGRR